MSTITNELVGTANFSRKVVLNPKTYENAESAHFVQYSITDDEAETERNRRAALNEVKQIVLAELGLPYEIIDGKVVENANERAVQTVTKAFPGAEDATPKAGPTQSAAPAQATTTTSSSNSGTDRDTAENWLRSYTGNFDFLLDVKAKTVDVGKSLTPGQVSSVLKCMKRENS